MKQTGGFSEPKCEVEREREVPHLLMALSNQTDIIRGRLNLLEERIEPILSSPYPKDTKEEEVVCNTSLGSSLSKLLCDLCIIESRISAMIARSEV